MAQTVLNISDGKLLKLPWLAKKRKKEQQDEQPY